ncbi:MAG: phosphatidylinositol mannoside acyltransferase [Egibacteraceae bacterium]
MISEDAGSTAHTVRGYRGSGHRGEPVDRRPGAADRLPTPRRPESGRERALAGAWLFGWEALRRLPEPWAFGIGEAAGRLAHRVAGARRAVVAANLRPVVGDQALPARVRAAFSSYARYWIEAFRAADISPAQMDARTTTDGFAHLDGVLEEGNGAIVLLAHHGSWDLAARWAETHGYHLAVVAEIIRPRRVFRRFVELREALGLEVVPLRRGEDLTRRLGEVLSANHLVGLLTDRDLSGRAPLVTLFGRSARLPTGAARLAARHGAPIVPISLVQRPGRRWHLQVLAPIRPQGRELRELHDEVARALERLIRLAPEQWHAFMPIWTDAAKPV